MDPSTSVWVVDTDPNIAPGLPAMLGERARVGSTIFFKTGPLDTDWTPGTGGAGGVISVSGTAGRISSTGGATPIIDLVNTAVVPGSYTYASITVDAAGRLTAASSGATPALAARVLTAGAGLTGGGDLSADRTFNVGQNADGSITVNADDIQLGSYALVSRSTNAGPNTVNLGALTSGVLQQTVTGGVATPTAFLGTQGSVLFLGPSGALAQDNANLFWNDTTKRLGIGTASPTGALTVFGSVVLGPAAVGTPARITNPDNFAGFAQAIFYPDSGTNVASVMYVSPRGTGYSATYKAEVQVYNTDYVADAFNTEVISIRAIGTGGFVFSSGKVGTGTLRPIMLSCGWLTDGVTNANQIFLNTDGTVGMGTGTPYQFARLHVHGGSTHGHMIIENTGGGTGDYSSLELANNSGVGPRAFIYYTSSTYTGAESAPTSLTLYTGGGSSSQVFIVPNNTPIMRFHPSDGAIVKAGRVMAWHNVEGTNYERVRAYWTSNIFVLESEAGGSGTLRDMTIQAPTATVTVSGSSAIIVGGAVGSAPSVAAGSAKIAISPVATRARATSAVLDAVDVDGDISITGAAGTNITTAAGFNYITIRAPNYSGGGNATTITAAATLMIEGAPVGTSSATISTAYALWVQGGLVEFSGNSILSGNGQVMGFFGSIGTTKQTPTGSRGGNAALASLLTALAAYGIITDGTSA